MKCKLGAIFFVLFLLLAGTASADPVFYFNPNLGTLTDQYGGGAGTFTRASSATYQANENGNLASVATDVHRFESISGLKYLLMEGAATNVVPYSSDMNSWATKTQVTISSAAGVFGSSGNNALIGSIVDGGHRILTADFVVDKSKHGRITLWLRSGDKTWIRVYIAHKDNIGNVLDASSIYIDIANSTTGSSVAMSAAFTGRTSNGFKEFVCLINPGDWDASTTKGAIRIDIADADNDISYQGDGSTVDLYIDGVQFEQICCRTSLILTSGTATSRTADSLTWTTTAAQSASLANALTIVAEWIPTWDVNTQAGTYQLFSSTDGASLLYAVSDGTNGTITVTDGTNTAIVALDWAGVTKYLLAVRAGSSIQVGYSSDNGASWIWGSTDSFDGAFADGGTLYLANDVTDQMHIGRIAWWNTDLGTAGVESFEWPPTKHQGLELSGVNFQ